MVFRPRQLCLFVILWCACVQVGLRPEPALAAPDAPTAPGSIAGTVRDAQGAPLAHMEVKLFDPIGWDVRTVTTSADGAYLIPVLPAGAYRVRFADPAGIYAPVFYPDAPVLSAGAELAVVGTDLSGIDGVLLHAGSIAGRLTTNGTPVTDAVQYALELYTQVDGRWAPMGLAPSGTIGDFRFDLLPPRVYRLCAYFHDYAVLRYWRSCYDQISAGVEAATDVIVQPGMAVQAIDIDMGSEVDTASLSGKVTDRLGDPLADMELDLSSATAWDDHVFTRTNPEGEYHFDRVLAGSYRVSFIDTQGWYATEYYSGVVDSRIATIIDLEPTEERTGIDAQLALGSGRITGTLTILGYVVPSAYVYIGAVPVGDPWDSRGYGARFDRQTGQYQLLGLPPGAYKVRADVSYVFMLNNPVLYYGGDSLAAATVLTVTVGATIPNIDFDYGVGLFDGVVLGRATVDGQAAPHVRVELHDPPHPYDNDTFLASTTTDLTGAYRFEGLTSNHYQLKLFDPTFALAPYVSPEFEVISGVLTPTVDAPLVRAGSISGHVFRRNGMPAAGAVVSTYGADSNGQSYERITTLSDSTGHYWLRGLVPGSYEVCVRIDGIFFCYGWWDPDGIPPPPPGYAMPPVQVTGGAETSGIDISLADRSPTYVPLVGRQ